MRDRYIPENVLSGKRILGFKRRNFIEGISEVIIFTLICFQIPFVSKIRWILIISVGCYIMLTNFFGISGNSFLQTLYNYYHYRYYLKQFSFRRLQHGNTKQQPVITNGKVRTIKENRGTNTLKKIIGK